jgi:hypothetical protein
MKIQFYLDTTNQPCGEPFRLTERAAKEIAEANALLRKPLPKRPIEEIARELAAGHAVAVPKGVYMEAD